jgi:hypothetical protein
MSEFGLYSKEQADQLWAWYIQNQGREDMPFLENNFDTPEWYFVKLKQDMDAATDPLTGYTEALAEIVKLSRTTDNKDREVVTDTDFNITITNRNTGTSASSGDFFWVREMGPEFVPFIGGGGSSHHEMAFIITAVDCPAGLVYTDGPSIERYTGCSVPPGVNYDGEFPIEDYWGFLSVLREDQILGQKGKAVYWNKYPNCDPIWDLEMIGWNGGCGV